MFGKIKIIEGCFWLFVLCILAQRIVLLFTININHIDADQFIMWQAARSFSEGMFYEPRYYGQDYNTMLESLLAAPLLLAGLPVYYAVPVITHILFLCPFLVTAFYLFFNQKKETAIVVLAILLCMPAGYDIINSLPRGFVTGLFFCSLFILSIQNPRHLGYLFLNTFLAYVAYLVSQNSVLVSGPFLFYLFLSNYRSKRYYLYTAGAIILALPVDYGMNHFYKVHPEFVHYSFKSVFSWDNFSDAIRHLDDRFCSITFFAEGKSIFLLLFFATTGVLLFRQNRPAFYAFLIFVALIGASFFSSKVADGFTWPFYSYSRMFLGIPVMLFLFMSLIEIKSRQVIPLIISATLLFTLFKSLTLKDRIAYHTDPKRWALIHLSSVSISLELINHYKAVCERNKASDLVLAGDLFCKDEVGYGGPGVYKDFPITLISHAERRTWRILQAKLRAPERFILFIPEYDFDKKGFDKTYGFKITRQDDYGCFLIEHNSRNLVEFLESIGLPPNGKKY